MPAFDFNGLIIQFETLGSGEPLLFLHGLGADRQQALQACQLVRHHQIIAVDMPGHGQSHLRHRPAGAIPQSFTNYAAIAGKLLDHLNIESALVGGTSMGAGVALRLALDRPSLCKALLLVRPSWLDGPALPHLQIMATLGQWLQRYDIPEVEAKLNALPDYQDLRISNALCAMSLHGAITRAQATESARVLPALVHDQPLTDMDELSAVTAPSLVMGNPNDPLHPLPMATRLAERLPNASYLELPGRYVDPSAHHHAMQDAIAQFARTHASAPQPATH